VLHLQARPPGTAFETRASVLREGRSIARTLTDAARMIFWLGLCVIVVQQVRGPARLDDRRADVLERFQQQRRSRAIALIHREETVSLLGVPVSRYIDIEDSEEVLRAIRLTAPGHGTLIALTPDELVMDPNAVLGPVDPQIGELPAASLVKLVALKPTAQIGDEMLVQADVASKARIRSHPS
jgi:ClpP class serine protease